MQERLLGDEEPAIVDCSSTASEDFQCDNSKSGKASTYVLNAAVPLETSEAIEDVSCKAVSCNNEHDEPSWNKFEFLKRQQAFLVKIREQMPQDEEREDDINIADQILKLEKLKKKHSDIRKRLNTKYAEFKQRLEKSLNECTLVVPIINPDESTESEDINVPLTIIQEIEAMANISGCNWKIVELKDCSGIFTTLHEKFEFFIEYNLAGYLVTDLKTTSILSEKAEPIAYLMQKELLRRLSRESIKNSIGQHYTILSLLDYIQIVMEKVDKLYKEISILEDSYQLKMTYDYKATFVILNSYLLIKWIFYLDLTDLDNIVKECVDVKATFGSVNKEYILNLVPECPKGVEFIVGFISNINIYLEVLKKRRRFALSKTK